MKITAYTEEHLPEMAGLFVGQFARLRAHVPLLPDLFESRRRVIDLLRPFFADKPGVVALDDSRVVGYLGAYLIDNFRGTLHRTAYVPEWGHAAASAAVDRALYRAAAALWFEAGCTAHCISLLAHDETAEQVWFWNGFGLIVVDGLRSTLPLSGSVATDLDIRRATPDDVAALAALDEEHARYYQQPPILMVDYEAGSADMIAVFMRQPDSSYWIAWEGATPVGFMRFERNSGGAASIVNAPDKIAISGAYVRARQRGRGIGKALLNAALRDYAARGFNRCTVDFESFNPDAASFWPKHFDLVRLSLIRVPERAPR